MKYLLLIYSAEATDPRPDTPEGAEYYRRYMEYTEEVRKKGIHLGGEALQPVATATTVRVRDGKTLTTDGPFAETKEQLGRFYFFECKDLDEAIAYAAKLPTAEHGSIEVRRPGLLVVPEAFLEGAPAVVAASDDGWRCGATRRAVGGAYLQRTSAASGDGRAVAAGRLSLSNIFW